MVVVVVVVVVVASITTTTTAATATTTTTAHGRCAERDGVAVEWTAGWSCAGNTGR